MRTHSRNPKGTKVQDAGPPLPPPTATHIPLVSQGLSLQTAGGVRIRSSNETLLRSPRGILLSAEGRWAAAGAWRDAAAGPGGKRQKGQQPPLEEGGHILLAPGAGSGVGIGPGFSSRDLAGEPGGTDHLVHLKTRMRSEPIVALKGETWKQSCGKL